jgi:hypothetical protein
MNEKIDMLTEALQKTENFIKQSNLTKSIEEIVQIKINQTVNGGTENDQVQSIYQYYNKLIENDKK